jgi:hypothetical protein
MLYDDLSAGKTLNLLRGRYWPGSLPLGAV